MTRRLWNKGVKAYGLTDATVRKSPMGVSLMERGLMIYRCNGRSSIGIVSSESVTAPTRLDELGMRSPSRLPW